METIINGWLSVWLYVMSGIAIFLSFKVYRNFKKWDKINILCTMAIIVLVLHVLEEWVFPGGLHYSYNLSHGSQILSSYPMSRLTDMITNFGGVILGCVVLKFWGFRKTSAIAVMLFSAFEVGIHVVIGYNDMATFSQYGMNVLYSPGLGTSLFGFLPVAVLLAKELFFSKKPRPTLKQWLLAIVVMFGFCFLLINLPEMLLSDSDTPYYFTNRGYYEKYGVAYENDYGLTYR